MNSKENNEPPRWVIAFFHWFCHPRFCEEIEGDLRERFQKRSGRYRAIHNKLLFIKDVITLFRPPLMGNFYQLTFNGFSSMKGMLGRLPEYYLILLVFAAGYKPPFSVNTGNLWVIAALILLVIFKNRIIWTLIGGLFIAINFYMILALISEFSKFPTFATGAQQLIFGGSAIILLNITMCGALIVRYTREPGKGIFTIIYLLTSGLYALATLAWSRRFPEHETSTILFYTGLVLCIFTFVAGMIVINRLNDKSMAENDLQRRQSKP